MDSIKKHLLKKNPSLSKDEVEKKAQKIWENYKVANKGKLDREQKEAQEAFNRSIDSEFGQLSTEARLKGELKGDELKDYSDDTPVEIWDPIKKEWIPKNVSDQTKE